MILVTGAAGRLGRLVADRLTDRDYEVRTTDRVTPRRSRRGYVQADLCDMQEVKGLFDGVDGVVHMGAIPGPRSADPGEIFDNNVRSTFNVMTVAEERGVGRVVFSSSAFGMGWAHDPRAFTPLYLPLDEEHPMMPFEPYGLSKLVGENIGSMVARRSKTTVASLRFTNVARPEVIAGFPWPAPTPEEPLTLVMWAYADADDVADAHVLALEARFEGHETFMLAQPTTRFAEPTKELIALNFGTHVEIRREIEGNASVIIAEKAERVLGWRPKPGWNQGG